MVVTQDINHNLAILGLRPLEIRIYQGLLASGLTTLTSLSKATNIPRTTVYRICEKLAKKNFIEWVIYERGKKVKVVEPKSLEYIILEKKDELESTQKAIRNLKSIIESSVLSLPFTKLRYYKGIKGMKQLIWNTLKAEQEIFGYSVYGRKKIVGEKFIERYVLEFKKRKLVDKVIVNKKIVPIVIKSLKGIHPQTKENVKVILERNFYISGDTYLYNNIYAVNFWGNNEIVGVEIENPEIVKVQKSIFNLLWKRAGSFKNN